MTPQQFDFHIHLVCDHPGSKWPDLLNSVYQLSIGSPYQLTSGSDTDKGGAPPAFDGGAGMVHDVVRQEMRQVLMEADAVPFLDAGAAALLNEAREFYQLADLSKNWLFNKGNDAVLLTWRGDWVNDGLAMLLAHVGLSATNEGVALTVSGISSDRLSDALADIADLPALDPVQVLAEAKNVLREKWDWALPEPLLMKSFSSLRLDLTAAQSLASKLIAGLR